MNHPTHLETLGSNWRRRVMDQRREWLVGMAADGWQLVPSGDASFLYLRKDGANYLGPVLTDRWAVLLASSDWFWFDVERRKAGIPAALLEGESTFSRDAAAAAEMQRKQLRG